MGYISKLICLGLMWHKMCIDLYEDSISHTPQGTVRDTDNKHFSIDMLCSFFKGSCATIRRHPHDNTWIVSRSMQCGKQLQIDAQSFALNRRRVLAAEEAFLPSGWCWGFLLGQVTHFVTHRRLKKACCKCIYVSRCNTVTAFIATSYCRYCQLGWLRFTINFKFVVTWFSLYIMSSITEIHAQLL